MLITVNIDIPKLEEELIELGRNYCLDNLKEVVISNDFDEDVKKYAIREEENTVQRDEIGETFGKTLKDEEDNKYNIIIPLIALPHLYREESRNMILHLLQHELAHVHDFSINYDFYKTFKNSETQSIACTLISEYSADRYASETNRYKENYGIDELRKWYLETQKTVESYKANLCDESISIISMYHNQFLRNLMSYLALIDGSAEDYDDAENIVLKQLTFCDGKMDIYELHRNLYDLFKKKNSKESEELINNISRSYYHTYSVWRLRLELKGDVLKIIKY